MAAATTLMSTATTGDLVKVNWSVKMEGGEPLPVESQVFDQGEVSLVVGAGGYLPCLHSAVTELASGASKVGRCCRDGAATPGGERRTTNDCSYPHRPPSQTFTVKAEDAYGPSDPNMGPVDIPSEQGPPGLTVGDGE